MVDLLRRQPRDDRKLLRSRASGLLGLPFIHPVIVAEVIVTAAADQRVLADPTATTDAATAWLVIGGTALFSARHAAFKATGWQTVPWSRLAAIVALGLFGLFGVAIESISVLGLGAGTGAIIVLFAISDRVAFRHRLLRRANADSSVTIDCNA